MNTIAIFTRRFIYHTLAGLDRLLGRKTQLAILCYHSISDTSWRFSISFREFKKQMEYLAERYQFITLRDVEQIIKGTKKADGPSVAIAFDDGYKDLFTTKEILKQYGIYPTLFVLSHPQEANRTELGTNKELMNDIDLLELREYGCTIGSHTATHPNLATLEPEAIEAEVAGSKHKLEIDMNTEVPYIAYPRGKYTPEVLEAVKNAGYTMGLSMDDGFITTKTDLLKVPRIGVDKTHNFAEFTTLMSPSCVTFRRIIKNSPLGRYL